MWNCPLQTGSTITGSKSKVISYDISGLVVLAKLGISLQEAHVESETESRVSLSEMLASLLWWIIHCKHSSILGRVGPIRYTNRSMIQRSTFNQGFGILGIWLKYNMRVWVLLSACISITVHNNHYANITIYIFINLIFLMIIWSSLELFIIIVLLIYIYFLFHNWTMLIEEKPAKINAYLLHTNFFCPLLIV